MKSLDYEINDCLSVFLDQGVLDHLDVLLARRLIELSGRNLSEFTGFWNDVDLVALGAAMASRAPGYGHVCFDVGGAKSVLGDRGPKEISGEGPLPWPNDTQRWLEALKADRELVSLANDKGGPWDLPLVLDEEAGYLYLNRYWQYELFLAQELPARLEGKDPKAWYGGLEKYLDAFKGDLESLMPLPENKRALGGVIDQRIAAVVSCANRFSVISGGPGTGKTTVVSALVLLLSRLHDQKSGPGARELRVELMAPTGKAAARMAESIRNEINDPIRGIKVKVPNWNLDSLLNLDAKTIHRALGIGFENATKPRYHRQNPIPADVVIVDEASMVDVGLMARLVDAVSPKSKLILLGDRDQLASVEAGAVLAQLCLVGDREPVLPWVGDLIKKVLGLDLPVAEDGLKIASAVSNLDYSFRTDVPEIVGLSKAIRQGNVNQAMDAVGFGYGAQDAKVSFMEFGEKAILDWEPGFKELVLFELVGDTGDSRAKNVDTILSIIQRMDAQEQGGDFSNRSTAAMAALETLEKVRILCTHRVGPRGVVHINRTIRRWMLEKTAQSNGIVDGVSHYDGMPLVEGTPIMVLVNDYKVQLFNGDIGIIFRDPSCDGSTELDRLVAVFPDSNNDKGYRTVSLGRLPDFEPVYAMTIHKSQGSQFDHAIVILPPHDSDLVTKELVYTGITRAKKRVTIVGSRQVFANSINRKISRASGLRKRLGWGE